MAIVFAPPSILQLFSTAWYELPLLHRSQYDVAYLEIHNPRFAKAYSGGIALQFFLCLTAVILRLYFSVKSNEINYISGRILIYVGNFVAVTLFCVVGAWVVLNVSAFGFDGTHSWFEYNPDSSLRGMPLPDNNLVFLFTGMFMPAFLVPILLFGLYLVEFFFGKRITISELNLGN
ncbi:hypothetical protein CQ057_22740 [Ochrobactrum sp. MYb49]|nr:hypothetical protein CQ057_22740 [Ochrobactrum sp. MYb49]